jgi:WD40 repeat protein/predicted DNA-binding WGR domain protein
MPRKSKSDSLVQALVDAARAAFTDARAAYPKERFYLFGLYSETGDDLQPTCNSEEALQRAFEKTGMPLQELRWFVEEHEYFQLGEDHFEAVARISDEPGADEFKSATKALKLLDGEGFFGHGAERDKVAVVIVMGDQSAAGFMELARQLNPPAVVKRLAKDFPVDEPVGELRTIGTGRFYSVDGLALSRDGTTAAACAWFGEKGAWAWSVSSAKQILADPCKPSGAEVRVVALSSDGRFMFGGGEGAIRRWDLQRPKASLDPFPVKGEWIEMALSPDDRTLACFGAEQVLLLLDAATGEKRRSVACPQGRGPLCFSPDGKLLATGGSDLHLFDATTLELRRSVPEVTASCLAFSPDGKLLLVGENSCGETGPIRLLRVADGKVLRELKGHRHGICGVAFSGDGRLVAAGGEDAWVRCWDASTGDLVLKVRGLHEAISAVAFMPDGKGIAGVGRNVDSGPPICVWKLPGGAPAPSRPARQPFSEKASGEGAPVPTRPARLHCTEGTSNKFWEAEVRGSTLCVRFGRIGTEGQSKDKAFQSPEKAQAALDKLIAEKRRGGYRDAAEAVSGLPSPGTRRQGLSSTPATATKRQGR